MSTKAERRDKKRLSREARQAKRFRDRGGWTSIIGFLKVEFKRYPPIPPPEGFTFADPGMVKLKKRSAPIWIESLKPDGYTGR